MEAAFFDLDKTVIAKASMVAFGRPLLDAGMISRWLVVRALWSNLLFQRFGADEEKMRKVRESALRITKGWDHARVSTIVRESLIDVIEPIVYDEAIDLIRAHHAAGRRIYLVSASPAEIVEPLALYLGVDEAIASRARIDSEGRYTGEVDFYSYGPYKADAIRALAERDSIDLERSFAYSDSITDLPMLECVGHPVAVNPDRELARVAAARGWETVHFTTGVPLRQRVNMPPPRKLLVVGAGTALAAGGGAALLLWARRRSVPARPGVRTRRRARQRAKVRPATAPPRGARLRSARRARRQTPARSRAAALRFRRPAASSPRRRRGRARSRRR